MKNDINLISWKDNSKIVARSILDNIDGFAALVTKHLINTTHAYSQGYTKPNGKFAYATACEIRESPNCPKNKDKKARCKDCPYRALSELTGSTSRDHILGKISVATFCLAPRSGETKYVVADFDNHDGTKDPLGDVLALLKVLQEYNIHASVFRSRSGTGLHVYTFFEEPVSTKIARAVIHSMIHKAGENMPSGKLESFDRIYPAQDSNSENQLGSIIALPYQGERVKHGCSVMLDPKTGFTLPYLDQYAALKGIKTVSKDDLESMHRKFEENGTLAVPKGNNQSDDNLEPSLNDSQIVDRFVEKFQHRIRYCHDQEKWFIWDGKRWRMDSRGIKISRMFRKFIRSEIKAARSTGDHKLLKSLNNFGNYFKIKNVVQLAVTDIRVEAHHTDWDSDIMCVTLEDGIYYFKENALFPHDRWKYCTKIIPISYNIKAQCPLWMNFLDRIMGGDQEMIQFLQKAVGYSLTGSTSEHCFFYGFGDGANGKSVFLSIIKKIAGEYAGNAAFDSFLRGRAVGSPRNDLAILLGKHLVTAAEAEPGQVLSESTIKLLTGEDEITVRQLYHENFSYVPKYCIWVAANIILQIKGKDHGIWRRVRLIPFTVTIPPEEMDKDLKSKLEQELEGILLWALEGARLWQEEGLEPPLKVVQATQGYRDDMDVFNDFIQERCITSPGTMVLKSQLYDEYIQWCSKNYIKREDRIKKRSIGEHLRILVGGLTEGKTAKGRVWQGIGLKGMEPEIATPQPLAPPDEDVETVEVTAVSPPPMSDFDGLEYENEAAEAGNFSFTDFLKTLDS